MKRIFIALTILMSLTQPSTLFAKNWEKPALKVALGAHRVNLNYTGQDDYYMQTHVRNTTPYSTDTGYVSQTLIARNTHAYGGHFEGAYVQGKEITPNFGLIAEGGVQLGIAGSLLDEGTHPALAGFYVSAGPCFHNDHLRFFVQGGVGIGVDIFGYPSVVDDLQNGREVQLQGGKRGFINANFGFHWSISTGIEFATSDILSFGLQYRYAHSFSTTTLGNETLDVSVHMLAITASI